MTKKSESNGFLIHSALYIKSRLSDCDSRFIRKFPFENMDREKKAVEHEDGKIRIYLCSEWIENPLNDSTFEIKKWIFINPDSITDVIPFPEKVDIGMTSGTRIMAHDDYVHIQKRWDHVKSESSKQMTFSCQSLEA